MAASAFGFSFERANYTVISLAGSVDQLNIKGIAPGAFTLGCLTSERAGSTPVMLTEEAALG